ncbi:MAG: hypothetical protein EOP52_08115 [Sphingobacteriales bacterium]|nr:MAG: hypothetical protein EOP52_08115 [Sphingobacteriales bacterium]
MRHSILITISLLLTTLLVSACKKDSETVVTPTLVTTPNDGSYHPVNFTSSKTLARYASEHYSQSISIGAANEMISSYLSSVQFPTQDTAIRSFAFDADTLRSYLADTSIKTIRFHMAHTPTQIRSAPGVYAGYNPQALTMIIVGYSENDVLIKNKHNGVYEHLYPCPHQCSGPTTGLLQ